LQQISMSLQGLTVLLSIMIKSLAGWELGLIPNQKVLHLIDV